MDSRTYILNRLRKTQPVDKSKEKPLLVSDEQLFADNTADQDKIQIYAERLHLLHGECFHFDSTKKASMKLHDLLNTFEADSCIAHRFDLLDQMIKAEISLKEKIRFISDKTIPNDQLGQYQVGISAADYLIARTGSVVVSSNSCGGRRLSVLPPVHVVLTTADQVVGSIENIWSAMNLKSPAWSAMSLISGPSRTSDIEKQLVLGAHGPKQLIVFIIE